MSEMQSLEKRIDKLEAKVENISTQQTKTDAQYGYIVQSIGELKGQVNSIVSAPNKLWGIIITALISALVTWAVTNFTTVQTQKQQFQTQSSTSVNSK